MRAGASRGVILDMDGLMLDTEPLYQRAWQEAVRRLGHELDDATYHSFTGLADADAEAALLAALGPRFPLATFQASWPALWDEEVRARGVAVKPGIPELLEALDRHGLPRAVATSSPAGRAERLLRGTGLAERFHVVVTCEAAPRAKPAPDLFLEAARRLGIAPAGCVVLEDSDAGARAAVAAGMRVLVVPDRRPASAETRALATAVHEDAAAALPELLALLADRGGGREGDG